MSQEPDAWRRLSALSFACLFGVLFHFHYHYPKLEKKAMSSRNLTFSNASNHTAIRKRVLQDTSQVFYRDLQDVPNPDWKGLTATLTIGENSLGPAYGSTIKISRQLVEIGEYKDRPVMEDVKLHVPVSSFIARDDFQYITRWYQEDYHTQIFRMFPGDDNVRNDREFAPRSEAFSLSGWKRGEGWHEWSGRYTFLKVRNGAVSQLKHNNMYWSIQLVLGAVKDGTFNLIFQTLRDSTGATILERDVVGKSFDISIQDDGTYHKVYVNGDLRIFGKFTNRTDDEVNRPRWGFYSPGSAIDRHILIFVTGAKIKKMMNPNNTSVAGGATNSPCRIPSNACGFVYAGYTMHKTSDNGQCQEQCAFFLPFRTATGWDCGPCAG